MPATSSGATGVVGVSSVCAATVKATDATVVWDLLSRQVDALIAAWDSEGEPPSLERFLPADSPGLRHLTLVELIKVDLEYRWGVANAPKLLEEYAAEFADLAPDGEIPCDLIYEEYQVRRQNGDKAKPAEYFARFPKQVPGLRRLLNMDAEETLTTSLAGKGRAPEINPGQKIDDFDLLSRLGKGAFASVFLARQISMQRLVALKISKDRGAEPQTLAQLDHPNIVRVYDQRTVVDQGLRLMYMQNIAGGTLHQVVEKVRRTPVHLRTGKLLLDTIDEVLSDKGDLAPTESSLRRRLARSSWPEVVCWLGSRLASALHYAHGIGVLHRDVKPANVLLCPDGSPKLADFNVSFSSKLDGASPAAYFGGSLAYMSPEQLEASDVDHEREASEMDGRSDVYSLAVMLWELLTGARPFDDTMGATWNSTLKEMAARRYAGVDLEKVERLPPDSPPALEDLLLRCLQASPEDRPQNAAAFARELELCLQPRAQRLMRPARGSLGQWLRRHPTIALLFCGLWPNVILSWFSIEFNWAEMIKALPAEIETLFNDVMLPTVNGIAYPVGAALGIWLCLPTTRALNKPLAPRGNLAALRERAVWLGDGVAWISLSLWIASGFIFPLWIRLAGGQSLNLRGPLTHFVIAQFIGGLIVATQVFFCVTFLSVRVFYPAFLIGSITTSADLAPLERLMRRTWIAFILTVVTPFVGFLLFGLTEGRFQLANTLLALIGLAGSGLAYHMLRSIQRDLNALAAAIDPERGGFGGGDSTDSFWSGSR